jgi:chromosome segregation ATPase
MDVEKTIEFILDLSAKTEQRFAQNEERFTKFEERFARIEENFAKADGRLTRLEDYLVKANGRFGRLENNFVRLEENFAKLQESFARAEARADRADRRMDRLETSLAQTIRVVKLMVRAGRPLRSDIRRLQKSQEKTEQSFSEINGKLDALIDIVDHSIRRNGGKRNH